MTTISYDLEETNGEWFFRFPADDETAHWQGPFTNREAADTAAQKFIEADLARHVAASLGLT